MDAHSRKSNEVKAVLPLWKMCEVFVKFALSLLSNSSDRMDRLGANTSQHACKMELYLEKLEHWNLTLLTSKFHLYIPKLALVQCYLAMVFFLAIKG